MYSFSDIIKSRFLEEFSEITIENLLTALLLSSILAAFIVLVYRLTYKGVLFNWNFALSLILLSAVTSLAILTVTSNIALSLGMVGALSIVRFRTAVKEPMDTIFMFWAIVAGITTGAGLIPVSVIATLLIGLIFLVASYISTRFRTASYLIILRYAPRGEAAVMEALGRVRNHRVKSMSTYEDGTELVAEARLTRNVRDVFEDLRKAKGVYEVSLVASGGTTTL